MADIELVIKIPEETYKMCMNNNFGAEILKAVKNGTALPKEHGRLIDADVLVDGMEDDYEFCKEVNATPTIIKAERGE